jgi:hypothetical protein
LYHYTTKEAFLGILQKKQIWASHIAFQNDRSEHKYAFELFKNELQKEKKKNRSFENFTLLESNKFLEKYWNAEIYTVSFSADKDILSQWRAYANSMPGFCISFAPNVVKERMKSNMYEYNLSECVYKKSDQEKRIKEIIYRRLKEKTVENLQEVQINTIREVASIAPILKNEKFIEEQEWRLVITNVKDKSIKKERVGRSYFVPYIEINLGNKCDKNICETSCKDNVCKNHDWISEVLIGPCVDEDIAKKSTIFVCNSNGLKLTVDTNEINKKILSVSAIPFRNY